MGRLPLNGKQPEPEEQHSGQTRQHGTDQVSAHAPLHMLYLFPFQNDHTKWICYTNALKIDNSIYCKFQLFVFNLYAAEYDSGTSSGQC